MTLSASVLILLSTFEADLGVVLMNTEGPVSREYQTGTLSSSRSLRTSSMILIDNGLARIVSSLPVIVMACKFSVSSSASLQISETFLLPIARLIFRRTPFRYNSLALKNGDVKTSAWALSVFIVDGIGTISVLNPIELADASCSAYERPFRFAYHMENPPTRLRAADPAPSLTTSDNSRGSMLSPRAFEVARPRAAKPDAEKPKPSSLTFAFLDSTRTRLFSPASSLSLSITMRALASSPDVGTIPLIRILSLWSLSLVSTVVTVSSDFMQTEILSWNGIRSFAFLRP